MMPSCINNTYATNSNLSWNQSTFFEFFPLDFATLPLKGVHIKKKLTTALTRDIPAIFSLGAMAFYSENVAWNRKRWK